MHTTPLHNPIRLRSVPVRTLAALLVTLALGGCVGWDIDDLNRNLRVADTIEPPVSSVDPAELNLLNVAAEQKSPVAYVLGAGDVVRVSVWQLDALGEQRDLTLTVSQEGEILLPLIGPLEAAGKSRGRLADEIRRRLAADYIRQPRVKVAVVEHRSRIAAVMGAVAKPGRYPIYGRAVPLLDLLGQAGGLTRSAADEVHIARGVLITESTPLDGRAKIRHSAGSVKVRLSRLIRQAAGGAPTLVYPGDLVTVNRKDATRFYVSGHVAKPGSYPRAGDMTLLQALTVAGGLSETADPEGLKIIRQLPRGGEELVEVNLTDIAAGREPDVRIQAADLVVVPTTPGRRARAEVQLFFSRLLNVGVDARYRAGVVR